MAMTGQTSLEEIQRKRALADMLSKGVMTPQQVGPNSSMLQALIPLAQAMASRRATGEANELQQGMLNNRQAELAKIMSAGSTPETTIEKPISGPVMPGMSLGNTTEVVPGRSGSIDEMVKAMVASSQPDIQTAGLGLIGKRTDAQELERRRLHELEVANQYRSTEAEANRQNARTIAQMGIDAKRDPSGLSAQDVDPNAPWRSINDPKKRDEAKTRFGLQADKTLEKEQEDVFKAQGVNQALDRFINLNETNSTGGLYSIPGTQFVRNLGDDEFKEMTSLADRLTPAMRQGMPGAASDRDVAMFRSATVGVDKPLATNKAVALGLKVANQNQIDRFQFMNEFLTEKGHLRGADVEWKKYLNDNPIFDSTKPEGSYELNKKRVSYQDWKGGAKQPGKIKFLGFE